MQLIGLARLGRDAEARNVGENTVANLSLAFDYYDPKSQNQNKRSTTWIDASLWGKQAVSLEQYLKKGTLVCCTVDDLHMETYQGRNGEGTKLVGRVTSIKLAGRTDGGGQQEGQQRTAAAPAPAPRPAPAPAPAYTPAPRASGGFDQMDDDIPF